MMSELPRRNGWTIAEWIGDRRPDATQRLLNRARWNTAGAMSVVLKQREEREVRPVPIPPELVAILLAHLKEFGTAVDGRLFRNERGGILGASTYSRAWEEARRFALTPQQVVSPLAGKPYDLRHAALSTWLNAGVDATAVAERAGNSVEVLLKRYAKCLDGRDSQINRRIEAGLAT